MPVSSVSPPRRFVVDINRRMKGDSALTLQTRSGDHIRLARLDTTSKPHKNPKVVDVPLEILAPFNGEVIREPHLHLYVEEFETKWAVPLSITDFWFCSTKMDLVEVFLCYSTVEDHPGFLENLFND